uniref:FAD synthase n=1 Tax=Strigomonas galati TaxID=1003336 RepID=T1YTW7_9TRYP|nr:FAD synthetase [Strigomonas galati]
MSDNALTDVLAVSPNSNDISPEAFLDLIQKSQKMILDTFRANANDKIGISFNGGKDSVVMMELIKSAVGVDGLKGTVIFHLTEKEQEFEELSAFRSEYMREHLPGLQLLEFEAKDSLKQGLWRLKEKHDIDVVFMGTRAHDPSGRYQKEAICPTTSGWPPMLRVCPVFIWSFKNVWRYITEHDIPYCSLYEKGYTSIGSPSNTSPNYLLKKEDGSYNPAWHLKEAESERSGRS